MIERTNDEQPEINFPDSPTLPLLVMTMDGRLNRIGIEMLFSSFIDVLGVSHLGLAIDY